MTTRTRKLLSLAGSVGLAASLIGCGTTRPGARAVSMPAPVTAAASAPSEPVTPEVTLISNQAPAPVAAPVLATPAAEPVAIPMCDSNGRPLAGNVKGKISPRECTSAELAAAEPGS